MKQGNKNLRKLKVLTEEQKKRFAAYLPDKVYTTERNISILVAISQVCMILMFMANKQIAWENTRAMKYFVLYLFLLITTCLALLLYRYTYTNKKYKGFLWLRRCYASMLCLWVLGITYMEQMNGKNLSVYCYLMPTTAALLLLTPIESTLIFGGSWLGLFAMLLMIGDPYGNMFGVMVNGVFVTVLTLFISYRYYRSTAVEFCDMETISQQYKEIERSNTLLQQMVHVDQLTGLLNRHYLLEKTYPKFEESQKQQEFGMFLMLDIDYFKQYNDTYGHIQGDECLRVMADVIRTLSKRYDAEAIRYGGEEFLIIKLSHEAFDAKQFANQLLKQLYDSNMERSDVEFDRVSVSIGLWSGELQRVPHIEVAIKHADDALYQAKAAGRNQIVYSME